MNFKFLSVLIAVLLTAQGTNANLTKTQKNNLLKLHRKARDDVKASNMKKLYWDDKLAKDSQNYANLCKGMVHGGTGHENLAGSMGKVSPEELFKLWTDEKKDFLKYGNPNKFEGVNANGKVIGHYTAVVWADNTKVGCGFASCPDYKSYLVCRYGTGNFIGKPVYTKKSGKRSVDPEEELPISNDRCGAGIGRCAPGLCCSRYGWCGTTEQHCNKGCQSEFGECN
ncbi:carbohydrate-binding module family 18 protein [Piromyces sp. E2]|nr:carbohydrate-binding module family 18 protein [Piromyces sp. E2]|eukprot:OUM60486.1 carbohydrate-binding module family 18 protein [Piromyces sp. E2]